MARQNERDGRGAWHIGIRLTHQRCRHVAGAILHVEPAGDFDLLHLFPRGYCDAKCTLDQFILRLSRAVQIEPHGAVRYFAVGAEVDAFEGGAARHINREHSPSRIWQRPGTGTRNCIALHARIGGTQQAFPASSARHKSAAYDADDGELFRTPAVNRISRSSKLRVATTASGAWPQTRHQSGFRRTGKKFNHINNLLWWCIVATDFPVESGEEAANWN